jgi:putative DNA primase/helicase
MTAQRYGAGKENANSDTVNPAKIAEASRAALAALEPTPHAEILAKLIADVKPVDFRALAGITDDPDKKLNRQHMTVCGVDEILRLASKRHWSLAKADGFVYLYNGAFWKELPPDDLKSFLGEAAERLGIETTTARFYEFRDGLYKQFMSVSCLPTPTPEPGRVLVNLRNGTFEVGPNGHRLRAPDKRDFLKYRLGFDYNPTAKCPMFEAYLNKVLPEKALQNILAEFIGYVFVSPKVLKLEKTLLLHGGGANGKSVFFEIINALLGSANVTSFSLKSLTDENGYFRAKLANSLLNYASEISGKLESSMFKALSSGEPVEARLPFKEPFLLTDYAKLMFNVNELPRETEQTHAFFRRFCIVPFNVRIPEAEQDKRLSSKIIEAGELSGVFNWVLAGLGRLLEQGGLTDSPTATAALDQYKLESDSVQMFLADREHAPGTARTLPLQSLFNDYRVFCSDELNKPVSMKRFSQRIQNQGFTVTKTRNGREVNVSV